MNDLDNDLPKYIHNFFFFFSAVVLRYHKSHCFLCRVLAHSSPHPPAVINWDKQIGGQGKMGRVNWLQSSMKTDEQTERVNFTR